MPGHYGNVANNLVSLSSPVATQMLHAVGIALAAKLRKTGQVPGRNNEIEADAFADQMLEEFRAIEPRPQNQLFRPTTPSRPIPLQFELFDGP